MLEVVSCKNVNEMSCKILSSLQVFPYLVISVGVCIADSIAIVHVCLYLLVLPNNHCQYSVVFPLSSIFVWM